MNDQSWHLLERINHWMEEAGIPTDRFIKLVEGDKAPLTYENGESVYHGEPEHWYELHELEDYDGNIGIRGGRGLIIVDDDNYGNPGSILEEFGDSFKVRTAHGGLHSFFACPEDGEGGNLADKLDEEFGVKNPQFEGLEVRIANQYTAIGRITSCEGKPDDAHPEGVTECSEEHPSFYELEEDKPLVEKSIDDVVELVGEYRDTNTSSSSKSKSTQIDLTIDSDVELTDEDRDKISEHADNNKRYGALLLGKYQELGHVAGDGTSDRSDAGYELAIRTIKLFDGDIDKAYAAILEACKAWPETSDGKPRKWLEGRPSYIQPTLTKAYAIADNDDYKIESDSELSHIESQEPIDVELAASKIEDFATHQRFDDEQYDEAIEDTTDDLASVLGEFIRGVKQIHDEAANDIEDAGLEFDKEFTHKSYAINQLQDKDIISEAQANALITSLDDGDKPAPRIIVKEHQGLGKTYTVLATCISLEIKFTYTTEDHKTIREKLDEAVELANEHNVDDKFKHIRAEADTCDVFTGEFGDDELEEAKKHKASGTSHGDRKKMTESDEYEYTSPCCANDRVCSYDKQFELDDTLGVFCHFKMLYRDDISTDRVVILDEGDLSSFKSELNVDSIRSAVKKYCEVVTLPDGIPTVYGDLTGNDLDRVEIIRMFSEEGVDTRFFWQDDSEPIMYDQDSITRYLVKNDDWLDYVRRNPSENVHKNVGTIVAGLLFSGKQCNGYYHHRFSEGFEMLTGCGTTEILNIPDFEYANAVIGLDATARVAIWKKFILPRSDIIQMRSDEQKANLFTGFGGSISVVGDNAFHGSGGRVNEDYIRALKNITDDIGDKAGTFATKHYYDADAADWYFGRDDKALNMADMELMILGTAPHPGDEVIAQVCAWYDQPVPPRPTDPRELGVNRSYGSHIANEVFAYFREDKIEQAILRGIRPHLNRSGLTVLSLTSCLPDWMPISENIRPPNKQIPEQYHYIAEAMLELDNPKTQEVIDYIQDEHEVTVSQQRVDQFTSDYIDLIEFTKDDEDKRAYRWILDSMPFISAETVEQTARSVLDSGGFVIDDELLHRISEWVSKISRSTEATTEFVAWLLANIPKLDSKPGPAT